MAMCIMLIIGVFFIANTPAHAAIPMPDIGAAANDEDKPVGSDDITPIAGKSIASEYDAQADERIAKRITSIFAEIDSMADIAVTVKSGVVTLSGQSLGQDAEQAVIIANSVEGVVTTINHITSDVAVDSNVRPAIEKITQHLKDLYVQLPLILVALVVGALIMMLGFALSKAKWIWTKLAPNSITGELISTSITFIFTILAIVVALDIMGATALLSAVLGGAGVIGLAIGFAVRDTVNNYVSSLMLSLRQPFRANDHVLIDQYEGLVVRLTSRATILMTMDGNQLRIPNAVVFNATITNFDRNPERRFQFDLGVDAEDDPVAAMQTGLAAIKALEFILDDPEASATIENVGDSNIVIRFYGWVDQRQSDFNKSRSLAISTTKNALENAGFALPEPIYRLRFDAGAGLPVMGSETGGKTRVTSGGNIAGEQGKDKKPNVKVPPPTNIKKEDILPESHIKELVEQERAEDNVGDLLDNSRPVE